MNNTEYNQTFPEKKKLKIIWEFNENKLGGV